MGSKERPPVIDLGPPDFSPDIDEIELEVARRKVRGTLFAEESSVQIDDYHIVGRAGSGGSGTVYEAIDGAGQRIALKLLSHAGPRELARLERELAILAQLSHPRIVRYCGSGRSCTGERYVVMEWQSGHDLAVRLARDRLTPYQSLTVAHGAAEGLSAAHRLGVIHRDIKPANLFLVDGALDGVRVIDFGLVRSFDATSLTTTGAVVGTPMYMAPEQIRGETALTAAVDVYALGVVLFESLTGRRPFTGASLGETLLAALSQPPPPPSRSCPGLCPEVDTLSANMLAKRPADRPRDGDAVMQRLAPLLARMAAET